VPAIPKHAGSSQAGAASDIFGAATVHPSADRQVLALIALVVSLDYRPECLFDQDPRRPAWQDVPRTAKFRPMLRGPESISPPYAISTSPDAN